MEVSRQANLSDRLINQIAIPHLRAQAQPVQSRPSKTIVAVAP